GFCNLETTIFFLFIFLTGAGISYPNAAAIAITPFSKNAGRASALLGLLQMGIGALMSAGVGVFAFSGILPTVIILSATSFVGLAFLIYGKKKKIILL
ncbi:MAG: Bcr/CflA family drug resistance efflux transporter, partial [Bacteriovoracaceae bacterium]|nr:Bcr/CflA family drug resistance efflux transporter [Bacteriovoracaceae bacterium]